METGKHIDLYADNIKEAYSKRVTDYMTELKLKCSQYKIKYIEANIQSDFSKILNTFMTERQKFN